jgi:hypothetical protein
VKEISMKYEPKYASDPGHPDYDQYMTLKGMVDKMHGDNGIDINSSDISHRATSSLLRAYKGEAISDHARLDPNSNIDGVALSRNNGRYDDVTGKYAVLYQGDPSNPTVRTLAVPTQELTQPAQQNLEEVNRINDQRQQQYAQTQSRQQPYQVDQEQGQEQPSRGSRSLL